MDRVEQLVNHFAADLLGVTWHEDEQYEFKNPQQWNDFNQLRERIWEVVPEKLRGTENE